MQKSRFPVFKLCLILSGILHSSIFFQLSKDRADQKKSAPIEVILASKAEEALPPIARTLTPPESPQPVDEKTEEIKKSKLVEQKETDQIAKEKVKSQFIGAKNIKVKNQTSTINKDTAFTQKSKSFESKATVFRGDSDVSLSDSRLNNEKENNAKFPVKFDYIEELDPALETLLNTRESVFFDYYTDLRAKISIKWDPIVRGKLNLVLGQGRSIANAKDQVTKCLVVIDQNGNLIKVQVIGRSELIELDEAAVEAFQQASPFKKPPKEMADTKGLIMIRWDFIIDS
jgi:protein TonB